MRSSRLPSLWLRLALPLALFVAAGSSGLVAWSQAQARREREAVFATEARTNAEFVRSARLPVSERVARDLGRVLGLRIYFHTGGAFLPPLEEDLAGLAPALSALEADHRSTPLEGRWQALAVAVDEETRMIFLRPSEPAALLNGETLGVLGAFWALSFALAWALSRGLVRPAALLGRMATGLAHEINNPLTAIRLHAQLLETSTPAAGESVSVLLGETQRIEGLVNQWMFLARPNPPQTARTALAPLVESVVRGYGAQAAHAGVSVSSAVGGDVFVQADSRRLAQAVGNVVLNAIQAMAEGGALRIEAIAGSPVRLVFSDSGPGFSPEALGHAADLFYSEKEGGMGIGLNVTAEILKAHGGRLRLANAPGGGGQVTFEVPSA